MLNKVVAKNFQSWKNLEFNVTSGVTLIDGWNEEDQTSEGSGKSSILNAISWCLFGKVPKDVNIDDVLKYGESSCAVGLFFDDGTQIIRSRGPNDLLMIRNAKTIKGKDSRETQQLIQDYIGLSFESFCQSSYFPQNYTKKFLLSNQEDKGKILSDIQDISIFDKARKEVQELAKLESNKLSSLMSQIQMEVNNLNGTKTQIKMVEDFIAQKIQQYEAYQNDLKSKMEAIINSIGQDTAKYHQIQALADGINIQELQAQIDSKTEYKAKLGIDHAEIMYRKKNIDSVKNEVSKKQREGESYAKKHQNLSAKLQNLESFMQNPTKNCPTCGTELQNCDTTHAQEEIHQINQELAEIVQSLTEISQFIDSTPIESDTELTLKGHQLQKEMNDLETQITVIRRKMNEKDMYLNNLQAVSNQLAKSQESLQSYQSSIDQTVSLNLTVDKTKLKSLSKVESDLQEKIVQLTQFEGQSRKYLEQLETLKEGFKEIKSYVFNSALTELSFRANEFLTKLFEVPAQIFFKNDDMKIETNIVLNDQTPIVGLLSGGQFRRFSLAVDLALADMTSSRKTSKLNILVLDEYFKDVSESTMEKCLELLKLRKTPVLLIEHNTIFKNIVDNVFFARYEKGTSYESR